MRVFISNTWEDGGGKYADKLEEACIKRSIQITRDRRDSARKVRVADFLKESKTDSYVIAILSDKYLKSNSHMFDLLEVFKTEDPINHLIPVILPDAKISPADREAYIEYWKKNQDHLNDITLLQKDNSTTEWELYQRNDFYSKIVSNLDSILTTIVGLTRLTRASSKAAALVEVIASIQNSQASDNLPRNFLLSEEYIGKDFIRRKKPIELLKELLVNSEKKVFCLHGPRASGKTTLIRTVSNEIKDKFEMIVEKSGEENTFFDLTKGFAQELNFWEPGWTAFSSKLLSHLRRHKILLIIDDFQKLSIYRDRMSEFLEGAIEDPIMGKIVFVSEKPLISDRHNGQIVNFPMRVLEEEEGIELLNQLGMFSGKEHYKTALVNFLGGNPLLLKLTAYKILEDYGGNIEKFLKDYLTDTKNA